MILHDYWRSGASYRLRIALNFKDIGYGRATYDLRSGRHREPPFLRLNPQGLVPALEIDGNVLTQSMAILEWLEETHPVPPLLPSAARERAIVRAMAAIVCCDIHPLNNLRVLNALRQDLHAYEAAVSAWIGRWIVDGMAALEPMIESHGGLHAFGDRPTFADCCLVPQVFAAERFGIDLSDFPRVLAVVSRARDLPAFRDAAPEAQPDADPA